MPIRVGFEVGPAAIIRVKIGVSTTFDCRHDFRLVRVHIEAQSGDSPAFWSLVFLLFLLADKS